VFHYCCSTFRCIFSDFLIRFEKNLKTCSTRQWHLRHDFQKCGLVLALFTNVSISCLQTVPDVSTCFQVFLCFRLFPSVRLNSPSTSQSMPWSSVWVASHGLPGKLYKQVVYRVPGKTRISLKNTNPGVCLFPFAFEAAFQASVAIHSSHDIRPSPVIPSWHVVRDWSNARSVIRPLIRAPGPDKRSGVR